MEFRCIVPAEIIGVLWYIDGKSFSDDGEETLEERGIVSNTSRFTYDDISFFISTVEARNENGNITLECLVISYDALARSEGTLLRIQGDKNIHVHVLCQHVKCLIQSYMYNVLVYQVS